MRRQFMVLRFFGRKTGHRYDIPIVAHWLDSELYALTDAPWRHNFRGARAPAGMLWSIAAVTSRTSRTVTWLALSALDSAVPGGSSAGGRRSPIRDGALPRIVSVTRAPRGTR